MKEKKESKTNAEEKHADDILMAIRETRYLLSNLTSYLQDVRKEMFTLIRQSMPQPIRRTLNQFRPIMLIKRILARD